jgi:hypothetical protein
MADESSENGSTGQGILIVDELDEEEMEPIRSKASFSPKNRGLLKLDQVHPEIAWRGFHQLASG